MVIISKVKKRNEERHSKTQYSDKAYGKEYTEPRVKYKKRKGTSGATGQLYESRLLSLVLFRCLTDDEVDDFLLGSNVDGVGDLDDICLRFTYKNKQVAAFIQSKHKDDASKGIADSSLYSPKSKVNLLKCFDSYLQVLNKFETDNSNIFNGLFKDLTFHFVVYTSAVNKITKKKIPQIDLENNGTFNKVKQILSCKNGDRTSEDIFQLAYNDQDVYLLSNYLVDMIAKYFVSVIDKKDVFVNYTNIVVPDVITLTENEDYYGGSVNPKVFDASDEILVKFKNKIYEETLSKTQVDPQYLLTNVKLLLSNDDEFSQRIYLSRLIYRYIVFDEISNKLTFNAKVKENVVKKYGEQLKLLQVSKELVNEALDEAGRELLKSVQFEIPRHVIDINNIQECSNMNFTNKINESAKDFLNKLYFYTNQGQAKDVAEKVTDEIAHYLTEKSSFKFTTQTDVAFLKFHDKIQKWWLLEDRSYFLTKTCDYLQKLASEITEPFVDMYSLSNKYHMNHYPVFKPQFHYSFLLIMACWVIGNIVDIHNKSNIVIVSNQCFGNYSNSIFGNISNYCVEFNDMLLDDNVTLFDMEDEIRNKILEYKVEFQGQRIKLNDLLKNDYSLFITGILYNIFRNEAITISHTLSNSRYEEIKDVYVQRTFTYQTMSEASSRRNTARKYKLNTFKGFPRNINIITAEAGMGKSTVLTHLSIETKKEYPQKWIIRMNLLDYCDEFKKLGTEVNRTEFMKLLLKSEFEDISKFSIKDVVGNVIVEYEGNDDVEAFALRIMMDCYSRGEMIFLFDGFDEICPDYITPATNFIKYFINLEESFDSSEVMTSRFQLWITSRPYNTIIRHLKQHFGSILTLEPLTREEQQIFFERYWSLNFEIHDLTMEQFNNIDKFFEFMSQFSYKNSTDLFMIPVTDFPVYKMYETAVRYFKNQIPNMPAFIDKDKILEKWISGSRFFQMFRGAKKLNKQSVTYAEQTVGVPLYMNMAASYFVDEIKTNNAKLPKEWSLSLTTLNYYKKFVELQFKVRFEEKNGMKLSKPDVKSMYNKEQRRFIIMHKKLAFYALFHRSEYYEKLLTITDRQDIESTIQDIVEGKEKTGLIARIQNKVPRFIHFSFTEYFAVEFIFDLIIIDQRYAKQCSDFDSILYTWIDFVVNDVLRQGSLGLLTILDQKLEHDGAEINEILKDESVRFLMVYLILEQLDEVETVVGADGEVKMVKMEKSLDRVLSTELLNVSIFLLRSLDENVTKEKAKAYIGLNKEGLFTQLPLFRAWWVKEKEEEESE